MTTDRGLRYESCLPSVFNAPGFLHGLLATLALALSATAAAPEASRMDSPDGQCREEANATALHALHVSSVKELPPIRRPPKGAQTIWPFYEPTQYLHIDEFNVHVFATGTVSEWMMHESYKLIRNIIAALKQPEDRAKFDGHQAFLITDTDPDLTHIGSRPGHRNTGGRGFSLFNEALVCTEAVDTIRPDHPPVYRAWNTPVHEFGHAIEHTLHLERRSNEIFSKNARNYNPKQAREYFAWATQKWFSCERAGGGRKTMPKWQYDYLASIFSEDNDWIPSKDPRP